MKKLSVALLVVTVLLMTVSCSNKNKNNPLLQDFTGEYGVPPFDKVQNSDYLPAITELIKQSRSAINSLVKNEDTPNFQNTIVVLDCYNNKLSMVVNMLMSVNSADTNDEINAIVEQVQPMIDDFYNEVYFNQKLFEKVKFLVDHRQEYNFRGQQNRTLDKYYNDFVRRGALLQGEQQVRFGEITKEINALGMKYCQNVLNETNAFKLVVDKLEDLEGLPQANIDAAAKLAEECGQSGKWVFTTNITSRVPFLQYVKNRELRAALYKGYYMRGDNDNENDNKEIVKKIVNLRTEKAKLLGYNTYAEYVLAENMAKTPQNVDEFLQSLWEPSLALAKKELAEMQKIADAEAKAEGIAPFKIESSDWWYYAEKLRNKKYNLDEKEIMPYLVLENVRDGAFKLANKLYGITFELATDIPAYNPEVEVYRVLDAKDKTISVLYMDFYTRPGKGNGAWCGEYCKFLSRSHQEDQIPLVYVVCNFPNKVEGKPTLLTWDDANTLFHEFGHALHTSFSFAWYKRLCGDIPLDMIELPSQINENWQAAPEMLKIYAKHYETGKVMPQELIDKIQKASLFNQGFINTELIAAAMLDMAYHEMSEVKDFDVRQFEKEFAERHGLIPEILPRYRSTYFTHIFDPQVNYSAGYYVYLWAQVLDADAYDYFVQSGNIFNKDLAQRFRIHVLTEGGLDDPMKQYVNFRGQEPSRTPLLKRKGLL